MAVGLSIVNGGGVNVCMVGGEVGALVVRHTKKDTENHFHFFCCRNVKSRRKAKSTSLHCTMYA